MTGRHFFWALLFLAFPQAGRALDAYVTVQHEEIKELFPERTPSPLLSDIQPTTYLIRRELKESVYRTSEEQRKELFGYIYQLSTSEEQPFKDSYWLEILDTLYDVKEENRPWVVSYTKDFASSYISPEMHSENGHVINALLKAFGKMDVETIEARLEIINEFMKSHPNLDRHELLNATTKIPTDRLEFFLDFNNYFVQNAIDSSDATAIITILSEVDVNKGIRFHERLLDHPFYYRRPVYEKAYLLRTAAEGDFDNLDFVTKTASCYINENTPLYDASDVLNALEDISPKLRRQLLDYLEAVCENESTRFKIKFLHILKGVQNPPLFIKIFNSFLNQDCSPQGKEYLARSIVKILQDLEAEGTKDIVERVEDILDHVIPQCPPEIDGVGAAYLLEAYASYSESSREDFTALLYRLLPEGILSSEAAGFAHNLSANSISYGEEFAKTAAPVLNLTPFPYPLRVEFLFGLLKVATLNRNDLCEEIILKVSGRSEAGEVITPHLILDIFAESSRENSYQIFHNDENVMDDDRKATALYNCEILIKDIFPIPPLTQTLEKVKAFILEEQEKENPFLLQIQHNGKPVFQNALRTLLQPQRFPESYGSIADDEDYCSSPPVSTGDILSRVWARIEHYRPESRQPSEIEVQHFKEDLVKALGDCIEEDDKRICAEGKIQRMIAVLQGRYNDIIVDKEAFSAEGEKESAPSAYALQAQFFRTDEGVLYEETTDDLETWSRKLLENASITAERVYGEKHPAAKLEFMKIVKELIELEQEPD